MMEQKVKALSTDRVIEILSASRRRAVIMVLEDSARCDFDDMVDAIAELEQGDAVDDADRKAVHVSLFQTHLPRLEDDDVVEWDRDRRVICRGPAYRQLHDALRCITDDARPGVVERLRSLF